MQKLVTIGLQSYNYRHGRIEEHLAEYLEAGWVIESYQIVSVVLGEANSSHNADVWIAVVLTQIKSSKASTKQKVAKRKKGT